MQCNVVCGTCALLTMHHTLQKLHTAFTVKVIPHTAMIIGQYKLRQPASHVANFPFRTPSKIVVVLSNISLTPPREVWHCQHLAQVVRRLDNAPDKSQSSGQVLTKQKQTALFAG